MSDTSASLFLRAEMVNALCKALTRTIEEDKDKSKRVKCYIHELGMKLDRTPLSEGGRGMSALDIGPDGVNLYAFTTCGHSRAPCQSRVIFPLLVKVPAKDAIPESTDAAGVVTPAQSATPETTMVTVQAIPTKIKDGESVTDIDTLTRMLITSGLIRGGTIVTHASIAALDAPSVAQAARES
jgi:hypothetical protein